MNRRFLALGAMLFAAIGIMAQKTVKSIATCTVGSGR